MVHGSPLKSVPSAGSILTVKQCESLGFVKNIVRCVDCERLKYHTGSATLFKECMQCCFADESGIDSRFHLGSPSQSTKYSGALIEYARMNWVLDNVKDTEIGKFFDQYKTEPYFSKVKFRIAPNVAIPRIVLLQHDGDANEKEVVAGKEEGEEKVFVQIPYWDAITIHEFMQKWIDIEDVE